MTHEGSIWSGWRLQSLAGRGGMGMVYRATHTEDGREAAIKTIRRIHPQLHSAIQREIRALSSLAHPGVATVYDWGVEDQTPWYAMEWLDGATLRHAMSPENDLSTLGGSTVAVSRFDFDAVDRSPMPRRRDFEDFANFKVFASALVQGLNALTAVHAAGLVHSDLKPEHFILDEDRVKLVDFGLACNAPGAGGRVIVESRIVKAGTHGYMSPEQRHGEVVDVRTDLWAIGMILHEYLTGTTRRVELREVVGGVPEDLALLVDDLLEPDPSRRIAYAHEAASRLVAIAGIDQAVDRRSYLQSSRLVGRDTEIRRGLAALEENQHLEIRGAIGVGKSRLLDEIARRWVLADRTALATTLAGDATTQLRAMAQSLRPHVPELALESDGPTLLAALSTLGWSDVLWVVDDSQRIQPEVARLVEAIARQTNVLFAFGSRSSDDRLELELECLDIDPGPLSPVHVGELARQIVGSAHVLDGEVTRSIFDRSGGNPLLVFEVIERAFSRDEPSLVWSFEDGDLGGSIDTLLRELINNLEGDERDFVLALELAGGLDFDILASLISRESARNIADQLERRGIIMTIDERIEFAHTVSPRLVRKVHGGAREAVARRLWAVLPEGSDHAALTRLKVRSTFEPEAIASLVKLFLKDTDDRRLAYAATEIWTRLTEAGDEVEAWTRHAETCLDFCRYAEADESLAQAEVLADDDERALELSLLRGRRMSRQQLPELKAHLELLRERINTVDRRADGEWGEYYIYEGVHFFHAGDPEAAITSFEASLKHYDAADNDRGRGRALQCIGLAYGRTGHNERSRESFEAAAEIQRECDVAELARTLSSTAVLDVFEGRYDRAVAVLEEALALPRIQLNDVDYAQMQANLATSLLNLGRRSKAREMLTDAHATMAFHDRDLQLLLILSSLSKLDVLEGNFQSAEAALRVADDVQDRLSRPNLWNESLLAIAKARLAEARGDSEAAAEWLELSIEKTEAIGHPGRLAVDLIRVAAVRREMGNVEVAREFVARAEEHVRLAANERIEALFHAESALVAEDPESAKHLARSALELKGDRPVLTIDFCRKDYVPALEALVAETARC